MMRALVVDDERASRELLKHFISRYCEDIEFTEDAEDVDGAHRIIMEHAPDLVFLDISLPGKDGFELLKLFKEPPFEVIFVTAYSDYAIAALRLAACDYLLKPIDINELQMAVNRAKERIMRKDPVSSLRELFQTLTGKGPRRIALAHAHGYTVVSSNEILRLESDGRYTWVFLEDGRRILVSKTLRDFEGTLEDADFMRIHNRHIINLNFVRSFDRKGLLLMADGSEVEVSKRKKEALLKRLGI